MSYGQPAPPPPKQLPAGGLGLTPGRITTWIREEGFRAKVELEGSALRITTGLAGYVVYVWCPQTTMMEHVCQDFLFDVRLKLPSGMPIDVVTRFLMVFNVNLAPATVVVLEPLDVVVIRMSFMVEVTSSTLLFARYFLAFDRILQMFSRDLSIFLKTQETNGDMHAAASKPPAL